MNRPPNAIPQGTRENFIWAFIGANGTGKTVESMKLARAWRKANPRRKIICFDPQGVFTRELLDKDKDILIKRGMKDFGKELTKELPNGQGYKYRDYLLIIDDYKMLCTDDRTNEGFLDLLALRRIVNCDIILSTHSPKLILERLSYYVTHYSIYFTSAAEGGFDKKANNYALCEKASRIINKYVLTYGKGQYPFFPYIMVHSKSDKLKLRNIDKAKALPLIAEMS